MTHLQSLGRCCAASGALAITVSLACGCFLPSAGAQEAEPSWQSAAWWRAAAARHIDQIDDDDARGRALYDFTYVRVRAGDLAGARQAAPRIGNTQLQLFAHLFIAKHDKLRGDMQQCLAQLQQARPVALADDGRYQMIDAYLDYAESADPALSFVSEIANQRWRTIRFQFLAVALARRGRLEDALAIVEDHLPANQRQHALRAMASASATAVRLDQVKRLVPLLADTEQQDEVWKQAVEALAKEDRRDEARELAGRIASEDVRTEARAALGLVDGQPAASMSADALRQKIAAAATREQKLTLLDLLLNNSLAAKDVATAERAIESMVEAINKSPRPPQLSKFGASDDAAAVASARSHYLSVAQLLSEQGDRAGARASLNKARAAVAGMPDSAGIGKFMLVMRLIQTQLGLGDLAGAKSTLQDLAPIYRQMVSGPTAAAFVRQGDVQTALEIADMVLAGDGPPRGIGDVASELIRVGKLDEARRLLARLGEGRDDADVFQEAGRAMLQQGRGRQLQGWLEEIRPVGRAYLCIGAAQVFNEHVTGPPQTAHERAVVELLTIPPAALPAGLSLEAGAELARTANPGVWRQEAIPMAQERLQSHRRGGFVELSGAYQARYFDAAGELAVEVECYEFASAAAAEQARQQMYVRPFADWYLQKGPLLLYVSRRDPAAEPARAALYDYFKQRP